jgi:hypothetical protein
MKLDSRRFGIQATAHCLEVDRITAEVLEAFRDAGIRAILLKGPAVATWLYADGAPRPYGDSDLLISAAQLPVAEELLAQLGFEQYLDDRDTPGWKQAGHHWQRSRDGADVDLHTSLVGAHVSRDGLWERLTRDTATMRVGGTTAEVLALPGRAFHVAIHAAHHGVDRARSLEDLDRAVSVVDEPTWRAAASLAGELEAMPAFATGLRLTLAGRELADRLEVSEEATVEATLLAASQPQAAMAWEQLAQAQGARTRASILMRKLMPTTRFMRAWSPLARRGGLGLAVAYAWRPFWLIAKAGPGFVAWFGARRSSR